MKHYDLDESFDATGEWFLPENPEDRVYGTLRYKPGNAVLELSRCLTPVTGAVDVDYPALFGVTDRGIPVSLTSAFRTGWSLNAVFGTAHERERVFANKVLIGAHVREETRLASLSFRVPGLDMWLCRPFVSESNFEDSGTRVFRFEVRGQPHEAMRIDPIETTLEWQIRGAAERTHGGARATLTSEGWIRLVPTAPQELDWYLERYNEVGLFLALVSGSSLAPDCAYAHDEQGTVDVLLPEEWGLLSLHDAARVFPSPRPSGRRARGCSATMVRHPPRH